MDGADAEQLRDDIRGLEIMRDRAVSTGAGEKLVEAYEHVLRRNREKLELLESGHSVQTMPIEQPK
jgi:hypothetical protein